MPPVIGAEVSIAFSVGIVRNLSRSLVTSNRDLFKYIFMEECKSIVRVIWLLDYLIFVGIIGDNANHHDMGNDCIELRWIEDSDMDCFVTYIPWDELGFVIVVIYICQF